MKKLMIVTLTVSLFLMTAVTLGFAQAPASDPPTMNKILDMQQMLAATLAETAKQNAKANAINAEANRINAEANKKRADVEAATLAERTKIDWFNAKTERLGTKWHLVNETLGLVSNPAGLWLGRTRFNISQGSLTALGGAGGNANATGGAATATGGSATSTSSSSSSSTASATSTATATNTNTINECGGVGPTPFCPKPKPPTPTPPPTPCPVGAKVGECK